MHRPIIPTPALLQEVPAPRIKGISSPLALINATGLHEVRLHPGLHSLTVEIGRRY